MVSVYHSRQTIDSHVVMTSHGHPVEYQTGVSPLTRCRAIRDSAHDLRANNVVSRQAETRTRAIRATTLVCLTAEKQSKPAINKNDGGDALALAREAKRLVPSTSRIGWFRHQTSVVPPAHRTGFPRSQRRWHHDARKARRNISYGRTGSARDHGHFLESLNAIPFHTSDEQLIFFSSILVGVGCVTNAGISACGLQTAIPSEGIVSLPGKLVYRAPVGYPGIPCAAASLSRLSPKA